VEGLNDNGNVPDSSQVTPQNAGDVFAVFDGRERQQVIQALLNRHTATIAELASLVGGSSAMVARHVAILEDLGVVTLDVPKGARRGRTVNATINRTAYASALGEWLREMGADS
jgi:predicted transcriptional regulator